MGSFSRPEQTPPSDLCFSSGVRVVADHLPPQIDRKAEYERIFELERKLGPRPEFAAIVRYTHHILRHAAGAKEDRI